MDRLIIDAPASITTSYLVCTHMDVDDPHSLIEERLHQLLTVRHPLAEPALGLLSSPGCTLAQLNASESGWSEELQDVNASAASRKALAAARFHLVLTISAEVSALPGVAQAMRLIARSLAFATGGVLVDPVGRTVLPDRQPLSEPAEFDLSQHWVTAFIHHREDSRHRRAETWGLARFGLPELCAEGFNEATSLAAINLVRGLAAYLVDGQWTYLSAAHPGPSRLLPSTLDFDTTWVYRYYNQPIGTPGSLPLLLRPLPNSPTGDLHIAPPDPAIALDRWWQIAAAVIPPLHPRSGRSIP